MSKLYDAFLDFHEANPHVYALFKQYAFQVIATGKKTFGVAAIWERLRWEVAMTTVGDTFKLNNNHKAYYSRLFMEDFPEHRGFFRTRTLGLPNGGHISPE